MVTRIKSALLWLERRKGGANEWISIIAGLFAMFGISISLDALRSAWWFLLVAGYLAVIVVLYLGTRNRSQGKWLRLGAGVFLVVVLTSSIAVPAWIHKKERERETAALSRAAAARAELKGKVVVLVAKLDGPDPKRYQVTDEIIDQLKVSLAGYKDVLVVALDAAITPAQGSAKARALGKEHQADLVLWGRYSQDAGIMLVKLHVENLSQVDCLGPQLNSHYSTKPLYVTESAPQEKRSFEFTERFSKEMTALVFFISGLARYQAQDFPEAARRFTVVLSMKEWPGGLTGKDAVYFFRGCSYIFMNNLKGALADFTRQIAVSPRDSIGYVQRGFVYCAMGDFVQGYRDCSRSIQLDPGRATAYYDRGAIQMAFGRPEEAIADFTRALHLPEESPDQYSGAYAGRAVCKISLKQFQSAIDDCLSGLRRNPEYVPALTALGMAYLQSGNTAGALDSYSRAVNLRPSTINYCNRALAYGAIGQYELALRDYSKVVELDPKGKDGYRGRGTTYMDLNKYDAAIAEFSHVLNIDAKDVDALASLGAAHARLGRYAASIPYYNRALGVSPRSDLLHCDRAFSYMHMGERERAVADCREVLSSTSDSESRRTARRLLGILSARTSLKARSGPHPADKK